MSDLQSVRTAEVVAAEIRALTASMLSNIIEIGRRMVEVKEMLPYGEFGKWIKENTGYSSSTANNFMRLFQEYGAAQGSLFGAEAESQTIGKLSYTKALALLSLPAEERESFAEQHKDLSTRELQQAIRERDDALRRAEAAEQEAKTQLEEQQTAYDVDMADMQGKLDEAQARIDSLKRAEQEAMSKYRASEQTSAALVEELETLKKQPATVIVDQEAVERARTAAKKEADEAHQKSIDALKKKIGKQSAALEQAEKQREAAKAELDKASLARKAAEGQVEELRAQLEAAKKAGQASENKDIVEFNLYFQNAQSDMEKMGAVLSRMATAGQSELAGKLKKAMAALANRANELSR